MIVLTNHSTHETFTKFGAPSALEIYDGQFWGVLTNSFVHNNVFLLILNLIALWFFGAFIERRSGFIVLFLTGILASIISSTFQLLIRDDPGIGLSGANYFLFGFIIIRSIKDRRYLFPLRFISLFIALGTIMICRILNTFYSFNIGLESIVLGLAAGGLTGFVSTLKPKWIKFVYGFAFITTMVYCTTHAYWSSEWNTVQGIHAHDHADLIKAEKFYSEALRINPKNENARENRMLVRIDLLSEKAFNLHQKGKYIEAGNVYQKILQLEPSNKWAKEQMDALP